MIGIGVGAASCRSASPVGTTTPARASPARPVARVVDTPHPPVAPAARMVGTKTACRVYFAVARCYARHLLRNYEKVRRNFQRAARYASRLPLGAEREAVCRAFHRRLRDDVGPANLARSCDIPSGSRDKSALALGTPPSVLKVVWCRKLLEATRCYLRTLAFSDAISVQSQWEKMTNRWKGFSRTGLMLACRAIFLRWNEALRANPEASRCFR